MISHKTQFHAAMNRSTAEQRCCFIIYIMLRRNRSVGCGMNNTGRASTFHNVPWEGCRFHLTDIRKMCFCEKSDKIFFFCSFG